MKYLNDGSRDTSAYDLFGCSEEELDRHIRDVFLEAGPDGLTLDEVYEQVSYRTTKQLVEGMVRDGQLAQLECGYCYLPSSRVRERQHRVLQSRLRGHCQGGIGP